MRSYRRRPHERRLVALAILIASLAVFLPGCSVVPAAARAAIASVTSVAALGEPASPFTAYFTDPFAPGSARRTGGLDEAIVADIDAARHGVDMAMYNLSLDSVAQALLRAHQRGVRVRLVMESGALDRNTPQRLMDEGITIIGDRREGLMHNKFIVIDGQLVWTGSLNLTGSGTYDDYNQMVRVRSSRVAQNYTTEFEEMFVYDQFGPGSPANTPYPQVNVDGRPVEVYFSPDDGVARRLGSLLGGAQKSIDFLAYSFTSDELAEVILARAAAGVRVRGVFETEQVDSNQGGDFARLQRAGLDVHRDALPGQMHMKVIIVDGQVVSFGSYNFSRSAERKNDENVMIVHDAALAAEFEREFEKIFAESQK